MAQAEPSYQSPQRKLVRFFQQSRDRWKAKHHQAKVTLKRLTNRVRFLERSKAHWKGRVKALEKELVQLQAEAEAREKELEELKKNPGPTQGLESLEPFTRVPVGHQYTLGHMSLFISLVLSAAASFRGASRAIEQVMNGFELPWATPSWYTGRLWLLRLGYYKLMRPQSQAEDWAWIVDHTVQVGSEKCLVILGIRLREVDPRDCRLTHEDVEPLTLWPVRQSNGTVVFEQLEQTVAKTGVPRQIIADQGSDVKAGIEQFCQVHRQTSYLYDIKHKTAVVLKHVLEADERWSTFTQQAAQTKRQLQQTPLAALAPPAQRSKARYMNLDTLVRWGQATLTFLDHPPLEDSFDQAQVQTQLGWLESFRAPLQEWAELLEITSATEQWIRRQGVYRDCARELEQHLPPGRTQSAQRVREQLLGFVAEESLKAKPQERLLASSEVLESVFGQLKRLEQDQAKSGFTGLLLSVAAMVSKTTQEIIQKALERVSTQCVVDWQHKILGESVQAKRRKAFGLTQ
jgi:hypothetical protein